MSEAGANPLERLPETRNLRTPLASSEGKVERLVSIYLRTLTSPQTIKTYNTEIRMFLWFVGEELGLRLEEVTVEDLSLYREHLLKAYAPATAAKKLTTLRRFLTFTYMSGATRINPEALRFFAKSPKVGQDPSYNVLMEEELGQLVQRYVLLSGRSLTSHADARKPLFASREGGGEKPLTTRSVRYIVKKYANAAGITKAISPHSIRHTVGTNMAVNEAPLLLIQQFLGHSDPKTTMRYVRRAEELASKAYTYNTLPL